MKNSKNGFASKAKCFAAISLILVFVFMAIASGFNSDWGKIDIKDLYYPNSEGGILHAQLFVPKTASSANPAPAILNMHGGSDYLQTVTNYTIELARRGYVVLTVDAYGSGSSDFVSGQAATNAGGSANSEGEHASALRMDGGASIGIEQLLSYKFVDPERIGLAGHSMGGTYIANTALEYADKIKAIMPWGSGSFVDMMKSHDSSEFQFNVGYINAQSDEMVIFATNEPPIKLLESEQLENFFGISEPIVAGKVYGDFEEGTARVIYTPNTTHIGNIICRDSIGSMVDYFEQAIPSGTSLSTSDQVWMYKEAFCVLAILALLAFIVSFGYVLLDNPLFVSLNKQSVPAAINAPAWTKLLGVLLCILVPVLSLHRVGLKLATYPATAFMPMNWANNLVWFTVIDALILLVIFLIWHFAFARKAGAKLSSYGFTDDSGKVNFKQILLAAVYAAALMFSVFVIVNLCYAWFKIDFRFWQFGIMPISLHRFSNILGYLLLFLVAFGIMNTVSNAFASLGNSKGALLQYVYGWLIGAGGFLVIMIIYYVGLKTTKHPPFFYGAFPFMNGHPNSLVYSMKTTVLVPTFTLISITNTALYRKTKNIYVGWFVAALFAALILIGTNAYAV